MCFLTMKASTIGFLFPWAISILTLLCSRVVGGVGASSLHAGRGFLFVGTICWGRDRLYGLRHLCRVDIVLRNGGQAVHRHSGDSEVVGSGVAVEWVGLHGCHDMDSIERGWGEIGKCDGKMVDRTEVGLNLDVVFSLRSHYPSRAPDRRTSPFSPIPPHLKSACAHINLVLHQPLASCCLQLAG